MLKKPCSTRHSPILARTWFAPALPAARKLINHKKATNTVSARSKAKAVFSAQIRRRALLPARLSTAPARSAGPVIPWTLSLFMEFSLSLLKLRHQQRAGRSECCLIHKTYGKLYGGRSRLRKEAKFALPRQVIEKKAATRTHSTVGLILAQQKRGSNDLPHVDLSRSISVSAANPDPKACEKAKACTRFCHPPATRRRRRDRGAINENSVKFVPKPPERERMYARSFSKNAPGEGRAMEEPPKNRHAEFSMLAQAAEDRAATAPDDELRRTWLMIAKQWRTLAVQAKRVNEM